MGDPTIDGFLASRSRVAGEPEAYYNLLKAESLEVNARLGEARLESKPFVSEVGILVEKESFVHWRAEAAFPEVNGVELDAKRSSLEVSPTNFVAVRQIEDEKTKEKRNYLFVFTEDFSLVARKVEDADGVRLELQVRAITSEKLLEYEVRKDVMANGLLLDEHVQGEKDYKKAAKKVRKYRVASIRPVSNSSRTTQPSPVKYMDALEQRIKTELVEVNKEFAQN